MAMRPPDPPLRVPEMAPPLLAVMQPKPSIDDVRIMADQTRRPAEGPARCTGSPHPRGRGGVQHRDVQRPATEGHRRAAALRCMSCRNPHPAVRCTAAAGRRPGAVGEVSMAVGEVSMAVVCSVPCACDWAMTVATPRW